MSFFTILLAAFTIILYAFLIVNRRSIVIASMRFRKNLWLYPFLGGLMIVIGLTSLSSWDEKIRTILAALVLISFSLDKKGLTEDALILNSLNIRGIPLLEIQRVVLMEDEVTGFVKMNYFRHEKRGSLVLFDEPLAELAIFFSTHLKEGSKLEILTKKD